MRRKTTGSLREENDTRPTLPQLPRSRRTINRPRGRGPKLREADLTDDSRLTLPQLAELWGMKLGTLRNLAHRDADFPPLRSLSKSKHGRKHVHLGRGPSLSRSSRARERRAARGELQRAAGPPGRRSVTHGQKRRRGAKATLSRPGIKAAHQDIMGSASPLQEPRGRLPVRGMSARRRKLIVPEMRLTLPRKGHRLSAVAEAAHDLKIRAFCAVVMDIDRALAVRPGRRGLCYHMEGDPRLDIKKDEFEAVERFIIECTKKGYLPWDLCAEDESRAWTIDEYDWLDSETAEFIASPAFIDAEARRLVSNILSADSLIDQLREAHRTYEAYGFWEAQRYYIAGIAVEKIDIFNVWEEVAAEFDIPICNIKGGWVPARASA